MPRVTTVVALFTFISFVGSTTDAQAHATYNLSGYGPGGGIGGSTNGADGSPAGPDAMWTNGPTDYAGTLPVNWYCGLHTATQVRTLQTGAGDNPPDGSLLQQVSATTSTSRPSPPIRPSPWAGSRGPIRRTAIRDGGTASTTGSST